MAYFRKYSKQNAAFGISWLGVISEGLEIRGTNPSKLPVFIINAEYENPLLDLYGIEFAHRLAVARRHAPRYMRLPRHNHIGSCSSSHGAPARETPALMEKATFCGSTKKPTS